MAVSFSSKVLDLSSFVSEVQGKETVVVMTPDGQVIASDFDPAGRKTDWLEEVFDLAATMAALFQDSTVSGLDSAMLEGSKKRLIIHRNQRHGYFVVVIGPETMDTGQAGLAAKSISAAVETSLQPKK